MSAYFNVTCDKSVVFSTNKTDRQDITEILLKVVLNTINHIPDLNIEIKGNYVIVINYIIVAL
jgi:hypothetical protein